ncbi:MAG: ornithine cyclodeaminase [Pseudomonadota bacterium]
MADVVQVPFAEGEARLDWLGLVAALEAGHRLPEAEIEDSFLYRGGDTVLSRAAWIDGLGIAVKTATVFPDNPRAGRPVISGSVSLFEDHNGALEAVIDFHLVTKWKTAADSLLAALRLTPEGAEQVLIVGAGAVARSIVEAFSAGFPNARFDVWSRSGARAGALADDFDHVRAVADLSAACGRAQIIVGCTMATEPVILGDWLTPGTHVNLIGAYRPDMREADDDALRRATLYVDSRATTLGHIGELKIPLEAGVIMPDDIVSDFYALGLFERTAPDEITIFKNGGGAHLDLMTSRYILERWHA